MSSPGIAIIGAGPAGLTLASLLTRDSIPFTIFDLRPRPSPLDIQTPSGSLDLHFESGQLALRACGLYDTFIGLSGECSEEFKLCDKHGSIQHQALDSDSGEQSRPEIARNALTQLLLGPISVKSIKWEHKISSVQPAEGGRWRLVFASRASDSEPQPDVFDLVIGADGAWSKVRKSITDVQPSFSGMNCVTLTIPDLMSKYPLLASMVGTGTYSACGERKAVMVQRGSLGSARIYLMLYSPSPTYLADAGLATVPGNELKRQLLTSSTLFQSWGDQLKGLIAAGCDAEAASSARDFISAKPLYELPSGHKWPHRAGLTLIGDAAHLTTPSGEGANAAMLDALELSQAIARSYRLSSSLDMAVKEYEEGMFPRAKEVMDDAMQMWNMIFAPDSPREFVAWFKSHGQPLETK